MNRGQVESKTIGVDITLNRRDTYCATPFNFNGNYMTFLDLDKKYNESKIKKLEMKSI